MRILFVASFGLLVASCSPAPTPVCNPGDTRTCVGSGACMGGQTCLADGTGFSACDCGGAGGGSGGGGGTTTGGGSGGGGGAIGGGSGGGSGGGGGMTTDAGEDAGIDAGVDAGVDAGADAGLDDAGIDAGVDAGEDDAGLDAGIDAGVDAGVDAGADAGQVMVGELMFLEVATLNPGTSGTFFGQGREAFFVFRPQRAPLLEEIPGSPLGCKAWELTGNEAAAWTIGVDEGSLEVSDTAGSGMPGPACTWSVAAGYTCPFTSTSSTGGSISAGPQFGLAVLTDTDVTYNATNSTNAYLRVQGAANAANNGLFPIVAVGGANSIVFVNPAFVAETLPGTASHTNFAYAGGTPMAADPGFIPDTAQISIAFTPGGAMDFAAFTAANATTVGDDFALNTSGVNQLNAVPRNGNPFTIACEAASCAGGSALFSQLDLVTTDVSTTGLSPFAMPAPSIKSVRIQCRAVGTSISVPAAYSALIQSSAATRIQTTFSRINPMSGGPATIFAGSGHAIRGFAN